MIADARGYHGWPLRCGARPGRCPGRWRAALLRHLYAGVLLRALGRRSPQQQRRA